MTNHIPSNTSLDSVYDAIATCDEYTSNSEANLLFDSMFKDMLVNSSGKFLTVSDKTRTQDMNALLDAYQKRVQVNADAWARVEAEFLSNISSYCFDKHMEFKNDLLKEKGYLIKFTPIKIKAVIDWLDLTFEVNPSKCTFAYKPNARSLIKSFLTLKTGTRHYVKADESDIAQEHLTFTIRLHDIKNKNDVLKIAELLTRQYDADISQMKIVNIELSLDFYHAPSKALLSALHKSLRYQTTADNFRIYKFVKEDIRNKFNPVPHAPSMLLKRFNHDWCLGVNPKGSPLCYRLYVKTTDSNKQPLPLEEHRLRVEVTLNNSKFEVKDHSIGNLANIIKKGFKFLSFTRLNSHPPSKLKEYYEELIQPFGKETIKHKKGSLEGGIQPYSELNRIVSKAVFNLSRNF
ncbi:hypothetical protein M9Y34_16650 [Acinetobacter baumannii]|uniref:hypothetical protein n=1 Tax=Acinetobacter baumannii TaxID=470 RepID=UPI00189878FC|nr:hypothetical protein [Acinetobacter baumannii]MBF6955406.1 hypothetical protein [Acinetobacter baumannii]MBV6768882.1 hypothetical protein [Acinetobacter baumannii]MCL8352012.1 hypothetical protein [Acinetobacter baumannii]